MEGVDSGQAVVPSGQNVVLLPIAENISYFLCNSSGQQSCKQKTEDWSSGPLLYLSILPGTMAT